MTGLEKLSKWFNEFVEVNNHYPLIMEIKAQIEMGIESEQQIQTKVSNEVNSKALHIADIMAMLPTEKDIDEWFTYRSKNPPYTNIKVVKAIEGANKYMAIMIQRLKKLKGN